MGYRRGDHVVYPKYGVGKIVKSEDRPVFGRRQRCLEIRFECDRRTVYVQESDFQRAHIRPVMGRKVLTQVYKTLKSPAQYGRIRPSTRRMESYSTKTQIGDPMSLAEVARDLVRRSHRHRLNRTEKKLVSNAVDLLAEEIAHVEQRKPETIRTKLDRILS